MQLIMQTPYSKMAFELPPDAAGELIQAAFRFAAGMAQLQPGWSDGIEYQDGYQGWERPENTIEEDTSGEIPENEAESSMQLEFQDSQKNQAPEEENGQGYEGISVQNMRLDGCDKDGDGIYSRDEHTGLTATDI